MPLITFSPSTIIKSADVNANFLFLLNNTAASVIDTDFSGGSTTTSNTHTAITGADITIVLTKTSHIVLVGTVSAYANSGIAGGAAYSIQWHDDTTAALLDVEIAQYLPVSNARMAVTQPAIIANLPPGTYTFTMYHRSQNAPTACTAEAVSLIGYSLPA